MLKSIKEKACYNFIGKVEPLYYFSSVLDTYNNLSGRSDVCYNFSGGFTDEEDEEEEAEKEKAAPAWRQNGACENKIA